MMDRVGFQAYQVISLNQVVSDLGAEIDKMILRTCIV